MDGNLEGQSVRGLGIMCLKPHSQMGFKEVLRDGNVTGIFLFWSHDKGSSVNHCFCVVVV